MPNMSIYVSMETFMQITELAQKNNISPSMQARRLIEEALKKTEKKPAEEPAKTAVKAAQQEEVKEAKHVAKKKAEHI